MANNLSSERPLSHTQMSTPPQACFDMKEDFFEALSAGEIDRASRVFSNDGVLLFPGLRPVVGRPLIKRMLGIIRNRYDDIAWRPAGPVISSEEWVVTSWSVKGSFRLTQAAYTNEVLSLVKLDQTGRIAVLSDYFKDTQAFAVTAQPSMSRLADTSEQAKLGRTDL